MSLSMVMSAGGTTLATWGAHSRLLSALGEVTGESPQSGQAVQLDSQQLETLIKRAERPQGIGECITGLKFGIPYKYDNKDRRRDLKALRAGMKALSLGAPVEIIANW